MPDRRIPSDAELRVALHDIGEAAWQTRAIASRLLWSATNNTLDADTHLMQMRDGLLNRDGP